MERQPDDVAADDRDAVDRVCRSVQRRCEVRGRGGARDRLAVGDVERGAGRRCVEVTAGPVVSMTMFFWPPRLDGAADGGRVRVAAFVAASRIVPPFSASEAVVGVVEVGRRCRRPARCSRRSASTCPAGDVGRRSAPGRVQRERRRAGDGDRLAERELDVDRRRRPCTSRRRSWRRRGDRRRRSCRPRGSCSPRASRPRPGAGERERGVVRRGVADRAAVERERAGRCVVERRRRCRRPAPCSRTSASRCPSRRREVGRPRRRRVERQLSACR